MFLALRDVEEHVYRHHKSAQSLLPASVCKRIHNIHHPSDPIVRSSSVSVFITGTSFLDNFETNYICVGISKGILVLYMPYNVVVT